MMYYYLISSYPLAVRGGWANDPVLQAANLMLMFCNISDEQVMAWSLPEDGL